MKLIVRVPCMLGALQRLSSSRAAREVIVRLAWFPGDCEGRLLSIENEDRKLLDPKPWERLFNLSLDASGENWTHAADLVNIARYGHFTDGDLEWENLSISSDKCA